MALTNLLIKGVWGGQDLPKQSMSTSFKLLLTISISQNRVEEVSLDMLYPFVLSYE